MLNLFFRLHVASDMSCEQEFKAAAVARFREEGLYRRWKLPQEDVERGLLERALTPLSFFALAKLYGVRVRARVEQCWFSTAAEGCTPSWWVDCRRLHLFKYSGETAPCFVEHPGKPLCAATKYTVRDLADLGAAIGVAPTEGSKAVLYEAVQTRLHRMLAC